MARYIRDSLSGFGSELLERIRENRRQIFHLMIWISSNRSTFLSEAGSGREMLKLYVTCLPAGKR